MRLYFIHMDGCPACAAGKRPLSLFERAHPEIDFVRTDLLSPQTKWVSKWEPRSTPTYIFEAIDPDGVVRKERIMVEGTRDLAGLEAFYARAKQMVQ